ncbi:MAG: phage tail tape measure protein [Gemmobacter sp.]
MNRLTASARAAAPALQSVGIQATTMAARLAGATPGAAGLAGGLVRLAASMNPVALAATAAVAVTSALVSQLMQGRKSVADMAAEFDKTPGSIAKVSAAVEAVRKVQGEYRDAVAAQGGAASSAATAVVAASKREFFARKSVLELELQILRTRGTEDGIKLREQQAQFAKESEVALQSGQGLRYQGLPDPTGFAARRRPGRNSVLDGFMAQNAAAVQEMAVLRGREFERELAIRRAQAALETEFRTAGGLTVGSGDKPGKGGAGGGAGQAAQNKLLEEGKRLFDQTRTAAERYAQEMARLNELLRAGAIDQDTYNRRAVELKANFESAGKFAAEVGSTVKSSLSSLFDALVEGGGKAGDVIEGLGKKLASMALQRSVFDLLARVSPGVFGAGGFVPLVGNATGNAFDAGRVVAFARGGVVTGPTTFPMRHATGLMGEAGPEAIMPLTRIGGRLGVAATGGGGAQTVIIDQRGRGAPDLQREERTGPDGRELMVVTIRDATTRGELDSAQGRFGARPAKVRR